MADTTYLYSRSRKAWFAKDASGHIIQVPDAAVPQAKRDAVSKKYAAGGEGPPTASSFGVRMGPFTIGKKTQTGMSVSEKAQREKLDRESADLLRQATDLQRLYREKIKPKLDSGQISSTKAGLQYTRRGMARMLGQGELDPDVENFITKTGQFATAVNSFYMQAGQGRASALGFKTIVMPHVPHPPSGPGEVLGLDSGVPQWDLQQQGGQIDTIIDNIKRERAAGWTFQEGGGANPSATATPSNRKPLPGGYTLDPATGKVYPPSATPTPTAKPNAMPPGLPVPLMKRAGAGAKPPPNPFKVLEIPPMVGGG